MATCHLRLRFIWLLTLVKALVTVSSSVQEAFKAKRSKKAELNCEKQHAAPLKSTYLKCYSEHRLVSNLPKNTSRCKGSLMSFSHCVLPHLKIIQINCCGAHSLLPRRVGGGKSRTLTEIQGSTFKLLWIRHPSKCGTLLFTVADTLSVVHGGASVCVSAHTNIHTHAPALTSLFSILPQFLTACLNPLKQAVEVGGASPKGPKSQKCPHVAGRTSILVLSM